MFIASRSSLRSSSLRQERNISGREDSAERTLRSAGARSSANHEAINISPVRGKPDKTLSVALPNSIRD